LLRYYVKYVERCKLLFPSSHLFVDTIIVRLVSRCPVRSIAQN